MATMNYKQGMKAAARTAVAVAVFAVLQSTSSLAAPSETMEIRRAQLAVGVCDSRNGGTGDTVRALLNDSTFTILDRPGADFGRGSFFVYDLIAFNRATSQALKIQDVTKLEITKGGSDGVAICSMSLIINGRPIFALPSAVGLDNSGGQSRTLSISGAQLRASPLWRAYTAPLPSLMIPNLEIKRRLESIVATFKPGEAYWRGNGVTITRKDATAVHVAIDLEVSLPIVEDPDLNVDFDLRFSCGPVNGIPQVSVTSQNQRVDLPWPYSGLETTIRRHLPAIGLTFRVPFCPGSIAVDAAGNVGFRP